MNFQRIKRILNAVSNSVFRLDMLPEGTVRLKLKQKEIAEITYVKNGILRKTEIKSGPGSVLKELNRNKRIKNAKELIIDVNDIFRTSELDILSLINSFTSVGEFCISISNIEFHQIEDQLFEVKEKTNKRIRYNILVDGINEEHDPIRSISDKLSDKKLRHTFLFRYRKNDVWNIDEKYYNLKKEGIKGCFIPVSLKQKGEKLFIDEEELDYDEAYNLALFYHKCLNDGSASEGSESRYYQVLYRIFSGDHDQKTLKQADLTSQGFSIVPALSDYIDEIIKKVYSHSLRPEKARSTVALFNHSYRIKRSLIKKRKPMVFIFGWYGTETVGDKAILAGIISDYNKKYNGNVDIVIGSLYPYITKRTVYELDVEARIVDTTTFDLLKYSALADEVVMGGGPLMDLFHLYIPLIGFMMAERSGNERIVYGCGLGPLKTEKYTNVVKEILGHSTKIMLRDSKSIELANEWGFSEAVLSGDPAAGYILKVGSSLKVLDNNNVIACFLRELPNSFIKGMSNDEFVKYKTGFEEALASFIKELAEKHNSSIVLYHMHNFVIGGDDRDFSRYFINRYFQDYPNVDYDRHLSTVDSIYKVMKSSKLNVCMRFHSVLFAETLNVDYVAVDYTVGGKIEAFLTDKGKTDRLYSIDDIKDRYL